MSQNKVLQVALVGNPNSGKSSIFNHLTGLKQKVGNFPGVTVEKKVGICQLSSQVKAEITDLPGTYSIYPKSEDEKIVLDTLVNPKSENYPDLVVVVVDASNIKRNLLLFTQVKDLGFPVILVLNMTDLMARKGMTIDSETLATLLDTKVVMMNARMGEGIAELKTLIGAPLHANGKMMIGMDGLAPEATHSIQEKFQIPDRYVAYQVLHQYNHYREFAPEDKAFVDGLIKTHHIDLDHLQKEETLSRYAFIEDLVAKTVKKQDKDSKRSFSQRLDAVLLHKVWGYMIFFAILFLIFQSIFAWANLPMDWIDQAFALLAGAVENNLPEGALTSLLAEGIIPGIGGVVIFIPQIAILFAFIAILEESGYMARVVFLMDKIMRKFGLNGRSVVPLISGVACAIPAIMATRTIDRWKDRLITILVTPLMSCSARLPIYAILIALVVPDQPVLGIFNLQGFALMGMYLLGFVAAILAASVLRLILKTKEKSYLVMELPSYKSPRWFNIGLTMVEKSKTFVLEAGKVILAISIILWVLASYGPSATMDPGRGSGTTTDSSRKFATHGF